MKHSNKYTISESEGPPCPAEPAVSDRLSAAANKFPSKLAVASLHQSPGLYGVGQSSSDTEYLRWTYAELNGAVDVVCANLLRDGITQKTPLVSFLYNEVEFVLTFWSAHRLGCPFVPLSPRSLSNLGEVQHIFNAIGQALVVAEDGETASKLDEMDSSLILHKYMLSNPSPGSEWRSFGMLLQDSGPPASPSSLESTSKAAPGHDIVTILFTSGTTSMPKGVPHTDTTLNAFCQNLSLGGRSERHVFCSVLPNNHAMGYFYTLHFMMNGSAVVYPGPAFEASSVVRALAAEKPTHTALVPTMLYALCEAMKSTPSTIHSNWEDICLSGASVSPKMIEQAILELGSRAVSVGFGMTEGSPIWSEPKSNPQDLYQGSNTIVGSAAPGAKVKLCKPGEEAPVPVGEEGEIHQTGPGLVQGYLGVNDHDAFYKDANGYRWFRTGDQAIMYPDGRFSITGRYKDLIIRGGKNISPSAIEATLGKVLGLTAQVIGLKDTIAGEIPIAITAKANEIDFSLLQETVRQHMGSAYVPDGILSLEELGVDDFPKTVSGKVQKAKLVELVEQHMSNRRDSEEQPSQVRAKNGLLTAYNRATGIPIENLDLDLPTTNFADSISLLRVRDFLKKDLGTTLTIEELAKNSSIRSQIELLENRTLHMNEAQRSIAPGRNARSTSLDDLEVLLGRKDWAQQMMNRVGTVLRENGLNGWDSVSGIMPAQDYVQVLLRSHIIDTWNFAIAVVSKETKREAFRAALVKALANHPILTSFYVYDGGNKAYYVTVKPSPELWSVCLIDHGRVKTRQEVQQLAIDYPFHEHASEPGPLFRCLLVDVEDTGACAMVFYVHHMVHDASSQRLFLEDLEFSLKNPEDSLAAHVDFKAWCDSYAALRFSPLATAAVNYQVRRLRGLEKHGKGMYPPARRPRKAISESPDGEDYAFDAPGLRDLHKADPSIIAAVVLKAAMAIVNVHRTGHTHALFNNFEASRKRFPFVPESVEALSPATFQASDVNGPVMQGVCNAIEVNPEETMLRFLQNLQREQVELTHYADAPLLRVVDALNSDGSGAGDMAIEVHRAQFLTWVPGFLGEYESFDVAQLAIRCAAGLVIVAGLGGPQGTTFIMTTRWDVANYSREEAKSFIKDIEAVVLWLTDPKNFESSLASVLGAMAVH